MYKIKDESYNFVPMGLSAPAVGLYNFRKQTTIKILNIRTFRSEQTDPTAPKSEKEQSDQDLHCLQFCCIFLLYYCIVKSDSYILRTIMVIILGVPVFRIFTACCI